MSTFLKREIMDSLSTILILSTFFLHERTFKNVFTFYDSIQQLRLFARICFEPEVQTFFRTEQCILKLKYLVFDL